MKKTIIFGLFFLLSIVRLSAQSNTVAVGGEATGSGGTASVTAGQVFYTYKLGSTASVSEGLQQSYLTMPLTGIISGNASVCVGAATQLSIALTGQGPWFGTLSDGTGFSGSDNPLLVTVTPAANTTYTIATLSSETATARTVDMIGSATVTVNLAPTVSLSASASLVCPDTSVTILADVDAHYYCNANTYNTYYQQITHIAFGSIDNDTSNDRSTTNIIHPFNGSTTTVVQPGQIYPLTVSTVNNPADVAAWIDYNRNGVYEASEYTEVFQDAFTGTVNVTIPSGATLGKTGMRVRSELGYNNRIFWNESCSHFTYGTTHDYTITIGQDVTNNTISWSSNPVDASLSNVNTASITTIPAATTTYTATATSATGCSTISTVTVNVQNGVIINTQPQELTTTCQGVTTAFSVAATGVGLTYQWYKEGQPLADGGTINGATSPTLNIMEPTPNDNGRYAVMVHPLCGDAVLSTMATLMVNPTPTVEPIASQTYCPDTLTSAIPILGTQSNESYNISGGAAIGLADAIDATSIPSFTAVAGTATITVTPYANGCAGPPTTFTITVNPRPTVDLTSSSSTAICPNTAVSISAAIAYTDPTASYCNSSSYSPQELSITNVSFGSINSDTSNDQLNSPNTHQETTVVQPGETYTLSVNANSLYEFELPFVGAWIDYNRNGIYEAFEYTEVSQNAITGSVNITIPTNAAIGKAGMRVRSDIGFYHNNSQSNAEMACSVFEFGTTQDYTITIGEDVPAYTISWSSNPVDASLSNVNTASIVPSPALPTSYTATVTPATGCATTTSILVDMLPAIAITSQPVDSTVCHGENATFSIAVAGEGLTYQWYKDGQPLTVGGTSSFLNIVGSSSNDNGLYTVIVHSQCGDEVLSSAATLTINQPTTETTVATSCGMYIWETGNNSDYFESGTYSYTENCIVHILELTVNQPTTATTVATSCGMYIWPINESDYMTSGTYSYTENCVEHILELTVNQLATVLLSASASIVCPDTSVTISADIDPYYYCNANTYNTYYQQITHIAFGSIDNDTSNDRSTINIIHPFNGSTTTVVQPGQIYPLTVSTVNNPADVGAWIDYNRNGVYEASEYIEVFQDAFTGTVNVTIPSGATLGKTGMRVRSELGYNNRIFWNESCSHFTYGTTHDYTITIGQDVTDNTISWSSNPVDASLSNVNTASITTIPAATTTYTATVTNPAGCSTISTVTVNVQNGVIINTQPQALTTTCQGVTTAFSIAATGVGLTYQWYKEGQPLTDGGTINGATSATLNMMNPTPNDNGAYTVMVHPICGDDVISTIATLLVNPTPTVEPIANQTYCPDTLTSVIPLTGTPSNVSYNISGGAAIGLADAIGATSIISFTAVAGTATITVTPYASGCAGPPTTFTITVNPRPTVDLTSSASTAICPNTPVTISAAIAYTDPTASYCNSFSYSPQELSITNVAFGTINSDTSNDQLNSPNTHQETTVVQPGETYTLSVNANSLYEFELPFVGAWIDYNSNGVYEASEYTEVYQNAITGSVNITIPTNAAIGKAGMRVRSDIGFYHSNSQSNAEMACSVFEFGTTQDYTITIGEDVPAYTISWSSNPVDASLSNANAASITPSPAVTTSYTATVTPATGCSVTSAATAVTVTSCSEIPTGQISGNASLCAGNSTQLSIALTGQGPWSGTLSDGTGFSGSDNPILVTVTPTATTTYTIATLSSETATASVTDLSGSAAVTVNQPTIWYADADLDTYGDLAMSQSTCVQPSGYVSNSSDCDDTNINIYQFATFYVDVDADGYDNGVASVCSGVGAPTGYAIDSFGIDCDDTNANVNTTTTETTVATSCGMYVWETGNYSDYFETGTYSYTENCVTHILELTVTQPTTETTVATSCGMYIWETGNNSDYFETGTYSYTENCVMHILELTVTQPTTETTVATSCGMYIWETGNNSDYFETGTYSYTENCVTHILELTVTQPTTETTVATSCGMYIWETGNNSDYFETGTYSYTENCVMHILELTVNQCNSITFDANGGMGTMSNQTIAYNASATLTANAFTRSGYTFEGWAASSGGSVAYADGSSYVMSTIQAPVVLYAKWTQVYVGYMQIFIRQSVSMPRYAGVGTTFTLDVDSSDSVENVKQKINDRTSVPIGNLVLVFAGTTLEDGRTLADYNIIPESTVHVFAVNLYPATSVAVGGTTSVLSVAVPGADYANKTVSTTSDFTGTLSLLPSGEVSIQNASPVGTYVIQIHNDYGSEFQSFNLTVYNNPTGVISGNSTICAGSSVQLSIAFTGEGPWFGTLSDGTGFSGSATPLLVTVTPSETITYTIATLSSGTATASTADLSGSAAVIVKALPMVTLSGVNYTFCAGGSIVLNAGPDYASYQWSSGQSPIIFPTQTIVVTTAGDYKVTVTNASGCSATSGVMTVTVNPLPSTPTISGNTSICAGSSTVLDAGLGYSSYRWSNALQVILPHSVTSIGPGEPLFVGDSTTSSIEVSAAGDYSVTVTNASGCSATSVVTAVTINTPTTWYADADADGYGDLGATQQSCTGVPPVDYVANSTDCDPTDGTKWQFATFYVDADADGYDNGTASVCSGVGAPTGYSVDSSGIDCDDNAYSLSNNCTTASIVNLKFYIQGYYSGSRMMTSVKLNQDYESPDTDVEDMTIELHDAVDYSLVDTAIGTLKTDGALSVTFRAAAAGSYYIVVKGSNLVQTWSAMPQTIGNSALNYDFSTSASQAYGDNMTEIEPGVFAMYQGELVVDDLVDQQDYTVWEGSFLNGDFGVQPSDLNGDGLVDQQDYTIWEGNFILGVFASYPF